MEELGRTVAATPTDTAIPRNSEETAVVISAATRAQGTPAPGRGHSFIGIGSPARETIALDLSRWSGIVRADPDTGIVTVGAGTPLHWLNTELEEFGLAMRNLGDIDRQTIAGAISTGNHGVGAGLGRLATQVEGLD